MEIIKPSYEILTNINGIEILKFIEKISRVCYKSEDKIDLTSYTIFIKKLVANNHLAMLEHFNISIKFIHNREFTHELVRHRVASYAQESTRYINYAKQNEGLIFIKPYWFDKQEHLIETWQALMLNIENNYISMKNFGLSPQAIRGILPNDIKTEIVVTTNLREWKHILELRLASSAHPDMRRILYPLALELKNKIPIIFDNL